MPIWARPLLSSIDFSRKEGARGRLVFMNVAVRIRKSLSMLLVTRHHTRLAWRTGQCVLLTTALFKVVFVVGRGGEPAVSVASLHGPPRRLHYASAVIRKRNLRVSAGRKRDCSEGKRRWWGTRSGPKCFPNPAGVVRGLVFALLFNGAMEMTLQTQ